MKKSILTPLTALTLFVAALFFSTSSASAQANCNGYTIDNKTNCNVKVNVVVLCGGAICASYSGITIGPVNFFAVPSCACGGGPTACDYKVTVVQIGSTTAAPLPITVSSGNPGPVAYPTSFCPAGSPYNNVLWLNYRTLIQ